MTTSFKKIREFKNFRNTAVIYIGVLLFAFTTSAQSTEWNLDPSHSSISFSIDHLVISETTGEFNEYSAEIKADSMDFSDAIFNLTIQTESIDTKDAARDEHLKSPDFFDTGMFPTITFKGLKFQKISTTNYKVIGDLTMHGITKKMTFDATFGGIIKDPWGGTRAGLKLWGEIDRYDFGLKYNSLLEAGGLTIGREVRIECRIELVKN